MGKDSSQACVDVITRNGYQKGGGVFGLRAGMGFGLEMGCPIEIE